MHLWCFDFCKISCMKLPRNRDQAKTPRREAKPLLLNPRIPLAPASLPRPQIQSSGTAQRSHLLDTGFRTFAASSPQASIVFASSFHTLSDLEYTCEQLELAAESLPPPTAVDPRYLHHLAFRSAVHGVQLRAVSRQTSTEMRHHNIV